MEKKINGKLLESNSDGEIANFKVKSVDDIIYNVRNCHYVSTDLEAQLNGYKCYSGNIDFFADGIEKTVAARIWVNNEYCVIVYNE